MQVAPWAYPLRFAAIGLALIDYREMSVSIPRTDAARPVVVPAQADVE